MIEPFSREMQLAVACCVWPQSPEGGTAIRGIAGASIDWDRFLEVIHRHRVEALTWAGLRHAGVAVPAGIRDRLTRRAAAIAVKNLANAAEEARLFNAFSDAGVDMLFVKGTTGAVLSYGSLAIKTAWDIDCLISRADAERGFMLLTALGYERRHPDPALTDDACRRWMRHSKETLWVHPDRGTAVELHTELVDNPELLGGIGLSSRRQSVRAGDGVVLPTLATDELLSYLCVHGTMHHWARVKWLADVAALIATCEVDCETFYRTSLRLGAGRCGAVALLLCSRLLQASVPAALLAELRGDPGVRILERMAFKAMSLCESQPYGTESAFQVLQFMAAQMFLKPGWRHSAAEISHRLFYPYSLRHLSWPVLLRPVLSLYQFLQFTLKRIRVRRSSLESWRAR